MIPLNTKITAGIPDNATALNTVFFLKQIIHITQYFRTDKMPISESIWDLSCRKCLKGLGGPFNCAKISKYIIHPLSLFSVFNT